MADEFKFVKADEGGDKEDQEFKFVRANPIDLAVRPAPTLSRNPKGAVIPKPEGFFGTIGEGFTGNFRGGTSVFNFDENGDAIRDVNTMPSLIDPKGTGLVDALQNEFGAMADVKAFGSNLLSLTEENAAKNILTSFPGTRAFLDQHGTILFRTPKGVEFLLNPPGFEGTDFVQGSVLAGPFTKTAQGVGTLTRGRGLLARMSAQALGQGLTAGGLDITSDLIAGSDVDVDPFAVGVSSTAGLLFPGTAGGLNRVSFGRTGNRFGFDLDIIKDGLNRIGQTSRILKQRGMEIPFSFAQSVGQKGFLGVFRDLQASPATADVAKTFLLDWNRRTLKAYDTLVRNISNSSPEQIFQSMKSIVQGSQKAGAELAKNLKKQYDDAFNNAFKAAEDSNLIVVVDNALDELNRRLSLTKEASDIRTLKSLIRGIKEAGKPGQGRNSNLRDLKNHIDTLESKVKSGNLEPKEKGMYQAAIRNLRDEMNKFTPYEHANELFKVSREQIKAFEATPFGQLGLITDQNFGSVAKAILGPKSTIQSIRNTKREILKLPNGQQLWDDMVAAELKRRGTGSKVTAIGSDGLPINAPQGGASPNTPAELQKALFGSRGEEFRKFQMALTPEMRPIVRAFNEMLNVAKGGRVTSTRQLSGESREIVGAVSARERFWNTVTFGPRGLFGVQGRKAADQTRERILSAYFDPANRKLVGRLAKLIEQGKWSDATGAWTQLLSIALNQGADNHFSTNPDGSPKTGFNLFGSTVSDER